MTKSGSLKISISLNLNSKLLASSSPVSFTYLIFIVSSTNSKKDVTFIGSKNLKCRMRVMHYNMCSRGKILFIRLEAKTYRTMYQIMKPDPIDLIAIALVYQNAFKPSTDFSRRRGIFALISKFC